MTAHLTLQNLDKFYGHTQALHNINLSVNEGEFVCLLGPSGCGKTTLLRMIAGFETVSSGDILLKGERINHLPPHKRDFGMVFQSLALFPHMTVAENIAYGMKRKGIDASKHNKRIQALLEMVKLPDIANRRVTQLSGGQQQRVAIARALAVPPKLFLLDEPLSALDAQIRENMQIELRQLQKNFGVTTILVTHDQHEAMMLADRLVVLKSGVVQQMATPSDMYRQPDNEFVAAFLGAANLLPAKIIDDKHIEIFDKTFAFGSNLVAGSTSKLVVRSEDVQLTPLAQAPMHGEYLTGEITFLRDLGAKTELLIQCHDTTIRCHAHRETIGDLASGSRVAIQFSMPHVNILKNN